MKLEGLRHTQLYKVVFDMLKAERELNRKRDNYWKAVSPTRKKQTSLYAQKECASEWFGKCELEFENYIKEHSIDGVFRLSHTDEFLNVYQKQKKQGEQK